MSDTAWIIYDAITWPCAFWSLGCAIVARRASNRVRRSRDRRG